MLKSYLRACLNFEIQASFELLFGLFSSFYSPAMLLVKTEKHPQKQFSK